MKVAFYTLGCKVNQYESNSLMEEFARKGYSIVNPGDIADLYVVNTCTVTHLADRKSRQYIKRMKKLNPRSIVAAIGCYVEISPDQVSAIEGVDIILGNKEKHHLPHIIEKMQKSDYSASKASHSVKMIEERQVGARIEDGAVGSQVQTNLDSRRTRAYIKIQEGCNRFCTYCIIPYARGPVKSRPLEDILIEAQELLNKGYKEIVLTGINTALYGMDLADLSIDILVENLNNLPGDFRLRLGSLEPNVIDWPLAEKLLKYEKLAHHMHLSLQSGSDRVLKAMNRRYGIEDFNKIIKTLRDVDPNYGISTDIIVGFPGESQEDFQDSLKAIRENKFVKTHAFPYSLREGTPAAKMTGQIPAKMKKARNNLMIQAGEESAQEFIKGILGKDDRVLVEEIAGGYLIGHTGNFLKTYIEPEAADGDLRAFINTFLAVNIKEAYDDGVRAIVKRNGGSHG